MGLRRTRPGDRESTGDTGTPEWAGQAHALLRANSEEEVMTNPEASRHIEVKDANDQIAAIAAVSTDAGPEGTVRTSMYAKSEHVRPGDRASLVDAVMELPEVKAAERLEATVPFGDAESVERLRERTDDARLRAAGASTLLDANVPRPRELQPAADDPDGGQQAGGEPPAGA
jgi:hypothetical protein